MSVAAKKTQFPCANEAQLFDAILALAQDKAVDLGRFDEVIERVISVAANACGVERVSVWMLNGARDAIQCAALYLLSNHSISREPITLKKESYPRYFEFFETSKTLVADDAHGHPNTSEFSEGYLTPLRISSMLDVQLRVGGALCGVICFEHVGPRRAWSKPEEAFASIMAEILAKAMLASERERKAKELLQASRLVTLGETSTMLAHEINNPLAIAKGYIEISLEDLTAPQRPDADVATQLKKALAAIQRASRIVRNLKLFARIDDRKKSTVAVSDLVRDALEMVQQTATHNGASLEVSVPDGLLLNCSALEIVQILINLTTNGIDAMRDGNVEDRWVRISAESNEAEVRISVANAGPRITDDVASRLFEPFFTTKGAKGTGLGLKISQQIAADHGGALRLASDAAHTTFVLVIPRGR